MQKNYFTRSFCAIAVLSLILASLMTSCAFPVRTGYDRKIGDYKPVPSEKVAKKEESAEAKADPAADKAKEAAKDTTKVAVKDTAKVATKDTTKVAAKNSAKDKKTAKTKAPKTAVKSAKDAAASSKKYSTLKEYTDSWLGVKYVRGGSSRTGTDCSGYIMNIFADMYGVTLPHKAQMMYDDSNRFSPVEQQKDLVEGDLVFFGDGRWTITHVGIYMGNGTFSHAATSTGVAYAKLSNTYWGPKYKGARRMKR